MPKHTNHQIIHNSMNQFTSITISIIQHIKFQYTITKDKSKTQLNSTCQYTCIQLEIKSYLLVKDNVISFPYMRDK